MAEAFYKRQGGTVVLVLTEAEARGLFELAQRGALSAPPDEILAGNSGRGLKNRVAAAVRAHAKLGEIVAPLRANRNP
jgi:hypothetical protein